MEVDVLWQMIWMILAMSGMSHVGMLLFPAVEYRLRV